MNTPIAKPEPSDTRGLRCHNPTIHLIGEIATTFGTLEFYLEAAIWLLLSGSNQQIRRLGEAITAEMSFDRKVHAFASVYKLRFPEEVTDPSLKKLVAALFSAQEKRNHILHSAWLHSKDRTQFTWIKASAKAKHGLRRQWGEVSPAELGEVLSEFVKVANQLGRFAVDRIQKRVADETGG